MSSCACLTVALLEAGPALDAPPVTGTVYTVVVTTAPGPNTGLATAAPTSVDGAIVWLLRSIAAAKGILGGGVLTQGHKTLLVCTWSVWVTAMGLKGVGVQWVRACPCAFVVPRYSLSAPSHTACTVHTSTLQHAKSGTTSGRTCDFTARMEHMVANTFEFVSPEGRMLQRVWCVWFVQAWLVRALVLPQCLWEHLPSRITTSRPGMVRCPGRL